MTALYIVIAGACCLVAGFLIGFFLKPAKSSFGNEEEIRASLEKKSEENASLKTRAEALEDQVSDLRSQLSKQAEQSEARIKEQKQEMQSENEKLQQFIKGEFERSRQEASQAESRQGEKSRQAQDRQTRILEDLSPIKENISALREKLNSIEEDRASESGKLEESVNNMRNMQEEIATQSRNISALLGNNQRRGAWGEMQLKNLVEKCGLDEHIDFETQFTLKVKGEDSAEGRPDLVVKFPQNGAMPVDAKAIISGLGDKEENKDKKSYYAKAVKNCIDNLSKKDYPRLLSENGFVSTPFTVAYIPVESWFAQALKEDAGLMEHALSNNIILCSPTNFWAILQAIKVSWKNYAIQKDTETIKKLGDDLYHSLIIFADRVGKLGNDLSTTLGDYNSLIGTVDGNIISKGRKLGEMINTRGKNLKDFSEIEGECRSSKYAVNQEE